MGVIQFFILLFIAFVYVGISALLVGRLLTRLAARPASTDQAP
jgi:hypothetical protein